jgi:hypothetical protein
LLGRVNLLVRNGLGSDLTGCGEADTMQGMSESVDTVMESLPETCRRSAGNVAASSAENKAEETAEEMEVSTAEASLDSGTEMGVEQEKESSGEVASYCRGMAPGSKATQFKPRHPGTKARKPERAKGTLKPCKLLRDMRFVAAHRASRDRTPGQRTCRRWLKENLKQFMSKLTALEVAYAAVALKERNAGQQR